MARLNSASSHWRTTLKSRWSGSIHKRRAHFYGPYSDEVANAVLQLKTIGAVDQNIEDWGYDRSGFEIKRYDYRLNKPGAKYAQGVAKRYHREMESIEKAYTVFSSAGDLGYMDLSIAAKTYFLLGQKKAAASNSELAKLAAKFGWTVTVEQVKDAVDYLSKLDLVELTKN